MKKRMIYFIIFLIVIISCTLLLSQSREETLQQVCKPRDSYQNLYELPQEDFKIFAIADKVNREIQYYGRDSVLSIPELLKQKTGDCDEYALLLDACLKIYGYNSTIISAPFGTEHHTYNVVNHRIVDASINNIYMINLYYGTIVYNYWGLVKWEEVNVG